MIKYASSTRSFNILLTIIEFLASILIIYGVTVTFGAYLFENFWQTLFFSAFMGVLCVAPCIILFEHDDPVVLFNRLFIRREFLDDVEFRCARTSVYAVVGSWFGAMVIPLDWDRWWQEWPISCCIGAILGAVIGILTGNRSRIKLKN